jgi:parallel beta-helix repeat protein
MRLRWVSILSMSFLLCLVLKNAQNEVFADCSKTEDNRDGLIGMANPAAVYCTEMGYEYKILNETSGQRGVCIFPDGSRCDAWDFLQGKCGQDYSYCEECGCSTQTVSDGKNPFSREYAVCVSKEGNRIGSVTELMALGEKATASVRSLEDSVGEELGKQPTSNSQLPSCFDWRNHDGHDWMTPVRDQGGCGSCWAFGAVGMFEAMHNIWRSDPDLDLDLSEQYLVSDCLFPGDCCGGSHTTALKFICFNGVPDEECLRYVDGTDCTCSGYNCDENCEHNNDGRCSDAACSDRCPDWQDRLIKMDSTKYLSMDDVLVKEHIASKGPLTLSIGMGAGVGYWDGDIYRCTEDNRTNHVVTIVGYDDEGGYWIVKNSYGTGFGDNGYFKLGYGECGVESTELSYHFMDQAECGCMVTHNTTLDHDLTNCVGGLSIEADGITVDCNGHLISGSASGIYVMDRKDITIKNCRIKGFGHGILLSRCSNSNLIGNILSDNRRGIALYSSGLSDPGSGNHVTGNIIRGSSKCGVNLYRSLNNYLSENRFEENYIGVCVEESSQLNTFWANHFIDNGVSALEDGRAINNRWNFGNVGNYWSDFESNPGYPNCYEIPGPGDGVDYHPNATPKEFSIAQNYPNPFNPSTTIEYTLPKDTQVRITIYNLLGRKVRTLVDEYQTAGRRRIVWDSKNDEGEEVASGIYFYQIKAGDFTQSKKMVIPK